MTKERRTSYIIPAIALLFILGNALLYLETFPALRWGFSGLRVVAFLYALAISIPHFRFGKYSTLVILFYLVSGIITICNDGSIHEWLSNTFNTIGLLLIIYHLMQTSPRKTIIILSRIFECFIYLNFITTLINPDGFFEGAYLLGRNHNQIGTTLICGLSTSYMAYNLQEKSKFSIILLCIVCILTPIIVGSMTTTSGCLLISLFFLIPTKNLRKTAIIVFFIFYMIFQSFVVFLQGDLSKSEKAVYLIENVMEKDMSFTNRSTVWEEISLMIKQSPITGYGMRDAQWFESQVFVKSAHNIIYQILIFGGYILLLLFLIIIISAIIKSIKHPSIHSQYVLFCTNAFFFMMIMECYNFALIFYILFMLYYSKNFDLQTQEQPLRREE